MKIPLVLAVATLLSANAVLPATAEAARSDANRHEVRYYRYRTVKVWVRGHYVWHHGHRHFVPGHYEYRRVSYWR